MDKEIVELQKKIKDVLSFSLPKYKELPSVELYMEQILKYINDVLAPLSPNDEKTLTSFMVNNYVKAKMVDEPIRKKYTKDQIGYLLAICQLKGSLSMADMALLLELDKDVSTDKGRLYAFWSDVETSILTTTTKQTATRIEQIYRKYRQDKSKKSAKADQDLRDGLAFLALRLSMEAAANKLMASFIISTLRKDMHRELPEKKVSSREIHHKERLEEHQAERLADVENKRSKIIARDKRKETAQKKAKAAKASRNMKKKSQTQK